MLNGYFDLVNWMGAVFEWCSRHSTGQILDAYLGLILVSLVGLSIIASGALKLVNVFFGKKAETEDGEQKDSKSRTFKKKTKARSNEQDSAGRAVDGLMDQRASYSHPHTASAIEPGQFDNDLVHQVEDEHREAISIYSETPPPSSISQESEWVDRVA